MVEAIVVDMVAGIIIRLAVEMETIWEVRGYEGGMLGLEILFT